MTLYRHKTLIASALCLALGACGGGGVGGGDNGGGSGDKVADSLTALGVDVTETPREGDDREPLPEDYSPFGSARSFETNEELMLLGFPLSPASGFDSELTLLELDRLGSDPRYDTDVLFPPDPALTPWARSVGDAPAALRAATRGDFDDDGLEELAVVYRAPGASAIEIQVYEDQTQSFRDGQSLVVSNDPATGLALASGDFNGDGVRELVVGVLMDGGAELVFLANDRGTLSLSGERRSLRQLRAGSELDLVLSTGNLDYDPSHELVAVLNERFGTPETGASRYYVFDDAKSGFAERGDGLVQANLANVNRTAIVADVGLGDIDGDNVDEMVFGGLTNFDPNGTCSYNYLLVALDDLERNRVPLGGAEHAPNIHGDCPFSAPGELRFVHVNALDIDGDGMLEIQANELVYEDFRQFPPWTRLSAQLSPNAGDVGPVSIPHELLFARLDDDEQGFTGRFDARNSTMVVADLSADKRQDIAFYSQATNTLQVWGLSDPGTDADGEDVVADQWNRLHDIEIAPPESDEPMRPQLVSANVNHDSLSISFDEGEYQLVFTEPVLIAALAAAPCAEAFGQNTDACRTSFGVAESTTVEKEDTFTVTAGVTVGFETEFSALGVKVSSFEMLATLRAHASLIRSEAYTLTKTVVYQTGPVEDTVIFTTIPLDQYTYTITSHWDQELIGAKVVVSMPREPIEIQVEREYYNANVIEGGPLIDSTVFTHLAGDPASYPGRDEKDSTITRYDGFDIGPRSVGRSGGDVTQEINVATESGSGFAYGVEFELEMQATVGVVVGGFSVGVGAEHSLSIVHGEESTYSGTVADMSEDAFAANGYGWGLFTYIQDDHPSGQQFEVINYWVQ